MNPFAWLKPRRDPAASSVPESPLVPFLPPKAWYARRPCGIHGVGHATRVLFWADVLAAAQDRPVMLDELRWAAVCHDIGRENDGRDPEHGQRSGIWVREHLVAQRPAAAQCDVEAIAAMCHCHAASSRGIDVPHLELSILRDADALDRARFRRNGRLDPTALSLPLSCLLIGPNQVLADGTRELADPAAMVAWAERHVRRTVQPEALRRQLALEA